MQSSPSPIKFSPLKSDDNNSDPATQFRGSEFSQVDVLEFTLPMNCSSQGSSFLASKKSQRETAFNAECLSEDEQKRNKVPAKVDSKHKFTCQKTTSRQLSHEAVNLEDCKPSSGSYASLHDEDGTNAKSKSRSKNNDSCDEDEPADTHERSLSEHCDSNWQHDKVQRARHR